MRPLAVFALLALSAAACGELDDVTEVKDLRVLGVRCDPAGFLVDLDNPGAAMQSDLTATLTALVADPLAPGGMVEVSAVGCPDYIDAITSATLQGSKLCPPPGATSQIPDPLGMDLATVVIVPADAPALVGPTEVGGIQYEPTISFGLTPMQIGDFFRPTPIGIPAVDESVALNRDFGLAAIVNLTFNLNGEHAEAIKHVVYWPRLDPAQQPNQNPVFGDPADSTIPAMRLYRHRNETTGDPDLESTETVPVVSISAGDKLYVQPVFQRGESYTILVKNNDTMQVEPRRVEHELLRFQFYATAGTFSPQEQLSELNFAQTGPLHTDSEYRLPKPEKRPADGKVTIWIVAHDERAGTQWTSRTITLLP